MAHTNRGTYQIKVGDITVTALNDGQFEAQAAWVGGISTSDLEQALTTTFRPFPPRITLNAFLLEQGDRTVLVDAGAGNKFGPALGAVGGLLAGLSVAPDKVGTILLTHAHVDHVGGLTDDAGAALFPAAELVLNKKEHDFWRDDAVMSAMPAEAQGSFTAARVALDAYKERTRLIGDGDEAVPGVRARALYGHTPGHTGYHIASGAAALLLWGDIVHLPGVQFEHPAVGMAFDADPAAAAATRRAIFDEVVSARTLIAGMHLDFPTFAHLRRHADRVEVVPHVWAPDA